MLRALRVLTLCRKICFNKSYSSSPSLPIICCIPYVQLHSRQVDSLVIPAQHPLFQPPRVHTQFTLLPETKRALVYSFSQYTLNKRCLFFKCLLQLLRCTLGHQHSITEHQTLVLLYICHPGLPSNSVLSPSKAKADMPHLPVEICKIDTVPVSLHFLKIGVDLKDF